MANTKSNIKRIRSTARKTEHNHRIRATVKTVVKKARAAIAEGDQAVAESTVKSAIQTLDRAATKKLIHKRNAARRKSRLTKQLNEISAK